MKYRIRWSRRGSARQTTIIEAATRLAALAALEKSVGVVDEVEWVKQEQAEPSRQGELWRTDDEVRRTDIQDCG